MFDFTEPEFDADVEFDGEPEESAEKQPKGKSGDPDKEMTDHAKSMRPRDDAAAAAFFGAEAFADDNEKKDDGQKEDKSEKEPEKRDSPAIDDRPGDLEPAKDATPADPKKLAKELYDEYKKAVATPESERSPAQRDLLERVNAGKAGDPFIRNPIDPNASMSDKVEQLRKLSLENEKLVKATAEELHKLFGSDIIKPEKLWGFKDPKDIELKAQREEILLKKPWHSVEHIRDAIRFRTVVNDLKDIPKIIEELKSRGFEIIKPEPEKLSNPRDTRLRMAPFDLRAPNGQIIEYYILPKESLEAMDGGHHAIYKKWRERPVDTLTPQEKIERDADLLRMRNMGDDAWEKYKERTGQTQADVDAVVKRVQEIAAEPAKASGSVAQAKPIEQKRPERVVPTADKVTGTDTKFNPDGSVVREEAKPGEVLAREQLERRDRLDPKEIEAMKRSAEELAKSDKEVDKQKSEALKRTIETLEGKHGIEAQIAAHKEMLAESRGALERGEGGGYGRAVVGGLIGVGILVGAALACYNHSLKKAEQRALERARVK